MREEFGSPELQELQKIRFLLESILNLKEEQMGALRGSAEPSPAEAGTHDWKMLDMAHGLNCDCQKEREPPKAQQ